LVDADDDGKDIWLRTPAASFIIGRMSATIAAGDGIGLCNFTGDYDP
jgi:hypothetical protein